METTQAMPIDPHVRAAQLSEKFGVKVHPLVFKDPESENTIIGFMKEPSRQVKLAVLDKAVMGGFSAAAEMLETILIREESDPRIYSDKSEDDNIYLGAVMAAYNIVQFSVNQAKKKP
jgi:hypothetical protein